MNIKAGHRQPHPLNIYSRLSQHLFMKKFTICRFSDAFLPQTMGNGRSPLTPLMPCCSILLFLTLALASPLPMDRSSLRKVLMEFFKKYLDRRRYSRIIDHRSCLQHWTDTLSLFTGISIPPRYSIPHMKALGRFKLTTIL